MSTFSPNTNLADARRLRAGVLMAMSLMLLISFGLLASGVADHRLFTVWDAAAKDVMYSHASDHDAAREFFLLLTWVGGTNVKVALALIVMAVLAIRRHWQLCGIWAVTTLVGFKLVSILKNYYDRGRPEFLKPIVIETSYSFPSGHSAGSAMLYGMLAYLLIRGTRRLGWVLAPFFALLIAAIGFSRIYLGAHWVSDVVGGQMLGLGWVALGMAAAEMTRER